MKKIALTLTPNQLSDVISCLDFGYRQGAAYGHVTAKEEALAASTRQRLIDKLVKLQEQS